MHTQSYAHKQQNFILTVCFSLHFISVLFILFVSFANTPNTHARTSKRMWKIASCLADPMEMSYLLGIAGGCLTAALLLVCLCIYAIRARKCCFKGKCYTYICCVCVMSNTISTRHFGRIVGTRAS